jgi:hypothetical protein
LILEKRGGWNFREQEKMRQEKGGHGKAIRKALTY